MTPVAKDLPSIYQAQKAKDINKTIFIRIGKIVLKNGFNVYFG